VAENLQLKKEPTPIGAGSVPFRLAVYGEGGVGKTTLALSFPKPLVIDTDGGLEGDCVADLTDLAESWTPEGWQDLNALFFWLKAQIKEKGYRTIVVDSIDTLARIILREAAAQPTRNRVANAAQSQLIAFEQPDYGKVAVALDAFLTNLKTLSRVHGVHVVLVSGVREPDPERGRLKRTFDLQPAVESALIYWANIYGEMTAVEKAGVETRTLWTTVSDPVRKNKTRFAALRPGIINPTFTRMSTLIAKSQEDA
jgi:hypothetical protein